MSCDDLKLGAQGAVSAALVQIVPLLLAGAHAAGAGGVVAGAALGFHLIIGKNEELTGWQRDGAALVVLTRLGVVLVAHIFGIVARRILPASAGKPGIHLVIDGGAVVVRAQLLRESLLNCAAHIGRHAAHGKRSAAAEQMSS